MFFDLETTGFDRPIRPVQVLRILDEAEGNYNVHMSYIHIATLSISILSDADWGS